MEGEMSGLAFVARLHLAALVWCYGKVFGTHCRWIRVRCAMHGAVQFWSGKRWIVFQPGFRVFGRWWPWYWYGSRDATPSARAWGFGAHRGVGCDLHEVEVPSA